MESWQPSPQDAPVYAAMYAVLDPARSGVVQPGAAANFFLQSGLDRVVLKQIWAVAKLNASVPTMSTQEVILALRCIALVQAHQPPTRESFLAHASTPLPPPRIAGVELPPAPAVAPEASWSNPPIDPARYSAVFQSADTNGDGFVERTDAVAMFAKSGTPLDAVNHVFMLCDVDHDGRLSRDEFFVAFHIILGASKRHLPIPGVLPPDLARMLPVPAPVVAAAPPAPVAVPQPMKVADAFGALDVDLPRADPPLPRPTAVPAMPAPTAPPAAAPVVEAAPRVAAPPHAAPPSAVVPPSVAAPLATIPGEVHAAARDLESSMQSHLKRENQALESRREANASLNEVARVLDGERAMFLRRVEVVRASIAEEDAETARVVTGIRDLRAQIEAAAAAQRDAGTALEQSKSRNVEAKGVYATLAAQLAAMTGRADSVSEDVRRSLEVALGAQLATLRLQSTAAALESIAAQHGAATQSNTEEVAVLHDATARVQARVDALLRDKMALEEKLKAARADIQPAIERYKAAEAAVVTARDAHEASIKAKMSAQAGFKAVSSRTNALEEVLFALTQIDATLASNSAPSAAAPTVVHAAAPAKSPAVVAVAAPVHAPAPVVAAPVVHAPVPAPVPVAASGFGGFDDDDVIGIQTPPAPVLAPALAASPAAAVNFSFGMDDAFAAPAPAPHHVSPAAAAAPAASADGFGDGFDSSFDAPVSDWSVPAAASSPAAATTSAAAGDDGFGGWDASEPVAPAAHAPAPAPAGDAFGDFGGFDAGFGSPAPAPAAAAPAPAFGGDFSW